MGRSVVLDRRLDRQKRLVAAMVLVGLPSILPAAETSPAPAISPVSSQQRAADQRKNAMPAPHVSLPSNGETDRFAYYRESEGSSSYLVVPFGSTETYSVSASFLGSVLRASADDTQRLEMISGYDDLMAARFRWAVDDAYGKLTEPDSSPFEPASLLDEAMGLSVALDQDPLVPGYVRVSISSSAGLRQLSLPKALVRRILGEGFSVERVAKLLATYPVPLPEALRRPEGAPNRDQVANALRTDPRQPDWGMVSASPLPPMRQRGGAAPTAGSAPLESSSPPAPQPDPRLVQAGGGRSAALEAVTGGGSVEPIRPDALPWPLLLALAAVGLLLLLLAVGRFARLKRRGHASA